MRLTDHKYEVYVHSKGRKYNINRILYNVGRILGWTRYVACDAYKTRNVSICTSGMINSKANDQYSFQSNDAIQYDFIDPYLKAEEEAEIYAERYRDETET